MREKARVPDAEAGLRAGAVTPCFEEQVSATIEGKAVKSRLAGYRICMPQSIKRDAGMQTLGAELALTLAL
ncbi:hypothetical protein B1R44_06950 [Serratia marcescens]|nr:hypothetical protein B1R44_06950 [Serratia marcescens]